MRRPVIFTLWRVLIGLVLVVGFPFAVSGQKYVETLEYLRMSIDASGLAYDKLEETEAYGPLSLIGGVCRECGQKSFGKGALYDCQRS